MSLVTQVDPGGELYLEFAKRKLRAWHVQMLASGDHSLAKVVLVTDGAVIYVNSVYLGHGLFRDRIRITGDREVTVDGGESVNVYDLALEKYKDAAAWRGHYTVRVTSDVTGLTLDGGHNFPHACTFRILNKAAIYGAGGIAGAHYVTVDNVGILQEAGAGGDALSVSGRTVTVDNRHGTIKGGGGGGGYGGSGVELFTNGSLQGEAAATGGGGGAGTGGKPVIGGVVILHPGDGANALAVAVTATNPGQFVADAVGTISLPDGMVASVTALRQAGGDSSLAGPGSGGAGDSASSVWTGGGKSAVAGAGRGGDGGDFAAAGTTGAAAVPPSSPPGAGGAAGKAIALHGGTVKFTNDDQGILVGDVA